MSDMLKNKDTPEEFPKQEVPSTKNITEKSLPEAHLDKVSDLAARIPENAFGLIIGKKPGTMVIKGQKRVILGRHIAKGLDSDIIDLAEFGAHEYGVSRMHASLELHDGKYILTDLNSTNGTFIANERLAPYSWRIMETGTQFRLANLEISIVYPDLTGSFPETTVVLYSRFHTTSAIELVRGQFFPFLDAVRKLQGLIAAYHPAIGRKKIDVQSMSLDNNTITVDFCGAEEVLKVFEKVINPDIRSIINPENSALRPRSDLMQTALAFAAVADIKEKDVNLLLRNKFLAIISDFAETGLLLKEK